MEIETIVNEQERGCGYRQPGGMYMMAPKLLEPCHRLPIELHVCPVCNGGIKPARGWTWIEPLSLIGGRCSRFENGSYIAPHCEYCVACNPSEAKAGLIWIGEGFYKTPKDFMSEVQSLGLSRRVSSIPRGFEPGKTVVYLVHPRAIINRGEDGKETPSPGIFTAFRPSHIEYILKGDETAEQLHKLEKRGLKLVRLVRTDGPQAPLPMDTEVNDYVV